MTSFCFFVQLADRTLILKQKEFFVFMIASRLFLNHSPSEWFSTYKKAAAVCTAAALRFRGYFVLPEHGAFDLRQVFFRGNIGLLRLFRTLL